MPAPALIHNNTKIEDHVVPFIALVVVIIIVIAYFISNSKKKDKGNIPGA